LKLIDTNIWLALALPDHVLHDAARNWFSAHTAPGELLFCRATQQSLLRLLTTAAVMAPYSTPPLTNAQAWNFYTSLIAHSHVSFAGEPANLASHWQQLSTRDTPSPKLWMDAYLAAFALAGGHQLVTTDRAFGQFAGLDVLLLAN
jgi:toxin-antitoxin system PIN domain toxin